MAFNDNNNNFNAMANESARTKFEKLVENEKLYDALFKQSQQGLREVYNGVRKSIINWRAFEEEEGEAATRALAEHDRHRADV